MTEEFEHCSGVICISRLVYSAHGVYFVGHSPSSIFSTGNCLEAKSCHRHMASSTPPSANQTSHGGQAGFGLFQMNTYEEVWIIYVLGRGCVGNVCMPVWYIFQRRGGFKQHQPGLNEVGEDVLDLLEFFISRYNHVNEATWWLWKNLLRCVILMISGCSVDFLE
jgi:hypothetical protein